MRKSLILLASLLALCQVVETARAGSVTIRASEADVEALANALADRGQVLTFRPPDVLANAKIVYAILEFDVDSLTVDGWEALPSRIVEIRPLRSEYFSDVGLDYVPKRHISLIIGKGENAARADITGLVRALQAASNSQWQIAVGLVSESVSGKFSLSTRNGHAARLTIYYR